MAIASQNKVEEIDQATGAIIGSPIQLPSGSNPVSLAYWAPAAANYNYTHATNKDPYVLVADKGTDKVSFIDAATRQYISSLSLGGSNALSVSASTTSDLAAVTDSTSTGHSRVTTINVPLRTTLQTFPNVEGSANALGQIIFDASGTWIYVAAPAAHKIHAFNCDVYGSCSAQSTLVGQSWFDPVGLAVDWTISSSSTLYITSNGPSGNLLISVADDVSSWGSIHLIVGVSVQPSALEISSGAQVAYIALPASHEVEAYSLSSNSVLGYETGLTPNSLALSWDSGTLLAGDSSSSNLGLAATSSVGGTFTDSLMPASVSAIAVPVAAYVYYDVVALTTYYINVIDSATGAVIEQWPDFNNPLAVVTSPDGRKVYVVDGTGGGNSGSEPLVEVLSTADFGTGANPVIATYPIAQSVTTPWSYSLAHPPTPKTIAISPDGDFLLIADSANSDILTMDLSAVDWNNSWEGSIISVASLNGTTAETPTSMAMSPDGSYAYVSSTPSSGAGGITVLSGGPNLHSGFGFSTYQGGSSLQAGPPGGPYTTLVDPISVIPATDDRSLFVLDANASKPLLFQFPTQTSGAVANESQAALPAGTAPVGLALSPQDNIAYVTDSSTDKTTAVNLVTGNSLYTQTAQGTPGITGTSPDGQYFAVGDGPSGSTGIELGNAADGSALSFVSLPSQPISMTISPVASSQWLSTTLSYSGGLGWGEELGGGANPTERGTRSVQDLNSAGTPSDAPGVVAGTNTALHSYVLSLNTFGIPSVGPSLNLTATYDSMYMAGGIDTSSSVPSFAFGWRLSTGVTFSQAPYGGLFPCRITVTQADGSQVVFEPTQSTFSSCTGLTFQPMPWEQDSLATAANCSGTDSCWVMTDVISGLQYFMDSTTSSHQLVKEMDRSGNVVSFSYSGGILASESGAGGRAITFAYPSAGTGSCPSTFNTNTIAKCMVATDPVGRIATYMLVGSTSTGYNLAGVSLSPPSGSTVPTATYALNYSGHYLSSWWDPNNFVSAPGNATEATDISYNGANGVSQVTGPTVVNQGTAMNQTYTPTTTFQYPEFDIYSGSGTVVTTDANANYDISNSTNLAGANITLQTYQNWTLGSTTQGYGAQSTLLPLSVSSNTITTQRDPFTLMPIETINPLADSTTSTNSITNLGASYVSYDALANPIASYAPGPTPDSWTATRYFYNQLNEPASSIDANGNVTNLVYDGAGNLTSVSAPPTEPWASPSRTLYLFDSQGQLCATIAPNGTALGETFSGSSCTYNSHSGLPSSYVTIYSYNSSGDLISIVDPTGGVSTSLYNADGEMCASLSANGNAAGYSLPSSCPTTGAPFETVLSNMDIFGLPGVIVTPTNVTNVSGGSATTACVDPNGNVIARISSMGTQVACSGVTVASPDLHTSYYVFNPQGELIQESSATETAGSIGPTTKTYFDPNGVEVASVSPNGVSSGNPASYESTSKVDNLSNVVSTTDALGNTSAASFDAAGDNLSSTTPALAGLPLGVTTTAAYAPDGGQMSNSMPSPSGSGATSQTNTYDGAGSQLTTTSSALNAGSSLQVGTAVAATPAGSTCWQSQVPVSSTPSCNTPPTSLSSSTVETFYDASGNVVAQTNPGGQMYTWNPATQTGTGCDASNSLTCPDTVYYGYDQSNRLVSVTRPAGVSGVAATETYYYDKNGNQVAATGPSGNPATCNPNSNSNCAGTVYSAFDGVDRLVGQTFTDGTAQVSYGYNGDGTRASITQGSGSSAQTTSYAYDPAGRVSSLTNGAGETTSYAYDVSGNIVCISYPSATQSCSPNISNDTGVQGLVTYAYNASNQITGVSDWLGTTIDYVYDPNGDVCAITTTTGSSCTSGSSGGVTTTLSYNQAGDLATSTTAGNGTTLLSFAVNWDGNGNLYQSTPTLGSTAAATDAFGYGQQPQVASGPVTSGQTGFTYGYLPDGEMSSSLAYSSSAYAPAGELCWTYSGTSTAGCTSPPSGATSFQYDATGDRLSSSSGNAYGWAQESGRLCWWIASGSSSSCSSTPSGSTQYAYDASGLRISATTGSSTTTFTWDELNSRLLSDGTWNFVYGPSGVPIEQIATSGSTPVSDLLVGDVSGNVRGLVRLSGGSLTRLLTNYSDYDAYGNPITASGGSVESGGMTTAQTSLNSNYVDSSPFGFGSGYTDPSGLLYLQARYYDPLTSQFVSADPLQSVTRQPYSYASDNPANFNDPSGMSTSSCIANYRTCTQLSDLRNPVQYGQALLNALGAHYLSLNNLYSIFAWQQSEAGQWTHADRGTLNPLNTELYCSSLKGSSCASTYPNVADFRHRNWAIAIFATIRTMYQENYETIPQSLQAQQSPNTFVKVVVKSGWGTSSKILSEVIGAWYTDGSKGATKFWLFPPPLNPQESARFKPPSKFPQGTPKWECSAWTGSTNYYENVKLDKYCGG